jgi:phage/plasmid-like protein (TIGR03299 family)
MTSNTARPIAPSAFRPRLAGSGGGDKAEYSKPTDSRVESGFYVTDRGLPWHVEQARRLDLPELMQGSGRKLTAGEALILAGLDWEVGTAPMFAEIDGRMEPIPGRVVTYRKDTGAILGSGLSTDFRVYQNGEAFSFADHILDVPGAHAETGGSLFGGRKVFLSMELPDEIHVAGDPSDFRLFLLLSNGHDGNHKLRLDITVERGVCWNTVRIGHQRAIQSWALRHTSRMDGRVQEARNALNLTHRYVEEFTAGADAMARQSLADRQVDEILRKLFPLTELQAKRAAEDASAVDALPLGQVRDIYHDSPSVAPVKGTAWGVFNAVTEWEDHFRRSRGGDLGPSEEMRADRLMFGGDSNDRPQRAWDLLLSASR